MILKELRAKKLRSAELILGVRSGVIDDRSICVTARF